MSAFASQAVLDERNAEEEQAKLQELMQMKQRIRAIVQFEQLDEDRQLSDFCTRHDAIECPTLSDAEFATAEVIVKLAPTRRARRHVR
jgi:hypothetical protein